MKKTIALFLSAVMSVSMIFCSCGKQGQGNTVPAETTGAEAAGTAAGTTETAGTTAAAAAETAAGETVPEQDLPAKAEEKVIEAPQIRA